MTRETDRLLNVALIGVALGAAGAMGWMIRSKAPRSPVSDLGVDSPVGSLPAPSAPTHGVGGASLGDLWAAICMVESGGDPNAIGDGGKAVGIAQLWPIMVEDCNRIAGRERWTSTDRLDVSKSREMFDTFAGHYGRGKSAEWIARAWCCGPGWENRPSAVAGSARYWAKVRKELGR